MGLLDNLERRASPELPRVNLAEPGTWLTELYGSESTYTGRSLSKESAMGLETVKACIQAISQDIGKIPLDEFRRLEGGGRERATDSPRYRLGRIRPNREQTPSQFRSWLQAAVLGWGNGFAEVVRAEPGNPLSDPVALWPLLPGRTKAKRFEGVKIVETWVRREPSSDAALEPIALLPGEYLHLPGLGFDGLNGRSPLLAHKQGIALGLAMQEWQARFYDNNATPNGWISVPHHLPKEKRDAMRDALRENYGGMQQGHRLGILWEAATYQASGVSPEAQQLVGAQNISDHRICSIFRVPPHKVGVSQPSTEAKSGIEQQAREYVTDTLMFWMVLWEQVFHWELTPPEERDEYFWKFNVRDLIRGDSKTEAEVIRIYVQSGIMSPAEARQLLDMNPADQKHALDVHLVQLNMVPTKMLSEALSGRPSYRTQTC